MIVADSIAALRQQLAGVRRDGHRIALVPTMGYLHEGHLALVDAARRHAPFTVMSSFVNPLQFGPGEDLDRYPRNSERDHELARGRGVDLMFAPPQSELYAGGAPVTRVTAAALSDRLCGRYRPGHFEGVLTVVAKLFNIVAPDVAVFGQKDLQQSVLIRRMVSDLDFPIEIVVAPIVRESDGLALSSRNVYLSPQERTAALALNRSLAAAQHAFSSGAAKPDAVLAAARAVLDAEPLVRTQYVELVDAVSLERPARASAGDAVALAAFVGATRLIDNHVLV